MNCGIYKIASPSGNFYIGSSANLRSREKKHFKDLAEQKHHCVSLQRAWNKYDGALTFESILICDKNNLRLYEQIALDGLSPKYNSARNATAPMQGLTHKKETREKIGKASKDRWATNVSYRSQMSKMTTALNKTRTFSPEVRAKMSAAGKARFDNDPELRAARVKSGRALRHTPEAKAKIGAASAADWAKKPEKRAKWSADTTTRNKAKIWTEEDRAKMSATKSARYANDPELRAKIAASVKGFKHTDEAKEKIGAASRNLSPESMAKRKISLKAAWARRKAAKADE